MSATAGQPRGAGPRASVAGHETQTTSSSQLSKDAQGVLFKLACSPPAAALQSIASAQAASARQRPQPARALLRERRQAGAPRGASGSPTRQSRRENWPGPLLRARLFLPR